MNQSYSPNYTKQASIFSFSRRVRLSSTILFGFSSVSTWLGLIDPLTSAQSSIQVRTNQWLKLEKLSGNVQLRRNNNARLARVGDRLQMASDELLTGSNSSAVLSVDTAVGTVYVAENTNIRINSFRMAPDNGRITNLFVSRGRARLQIRKFTNRGSQLNIQTPAGVSGVRGTNFGVIALENGDTVLTTYQGSVASTAQNRTELVKAGTENFTLVGQPPSKPIAIRDDPSLRYTIERQVFNNERSVLLVGYTNPVNIVKIDETPRLQRNGKFEIRLPATSSLNVNVTIETPQGQVKTYRIPIL
ncbi:MAG: FecR domain-containing protein [Pseudanabaenaceae cyanobacterium bins.39]|nr:FecR domain-containing protein [Pseudanabaenaceae cyanobacterium bins.39]